MWFLRDLQCFVYFTRGNNSAKFRRLYAVGGCMVLMWLSTHGFLLYRRQREHRYLTKKIPTISWEDFVEDYLMRGLVNLLLRSLICFIRSSLEQLIIVACGRRLHHPTSKIDANVRDQVAYDLRALVPAIHCRVLALIQKAPRSFRAGVLDSCARILTFTSKSSPLCFCILCVPSGVLRLSFRLPSRCSFIRIHKGLPVSPIYSSPQLLHEIRYVVPELMQSPSLP
ncbi:unnamed protein product [Angiostrongylus costaricensis]|uniref:Transmembrane protein n=1 Tax=Angiostrongylus costaricensis TaxID=334426 RepID=A0A0R3PV87_ANGCS|nr:unnamed protein product [Angiostrongylus costaricensis]